MTESNSSDYKSEQINQIVLIILSGHMTSTEVCKKYNISPETLDNWMSNYLVNLEKLLEGSDGGQDSDWLVNIEESIRNLPEYVGETIIEPDDDTVEKSLDRMEMHVTKFEEDYLNVGKIPRNHIWRPYRFCVQDVVLGLVVVKHSLKNNNLEVDVCLTSDAPDYEVYSGAKMTMAFLLSEAYKCGGSMEIQFIEHDENKMVPYAICELADYLGVSLGHIQDGRIARSEARQYYMALTEFSPALTNKIFELSAENKLSEESVCYVVNSGMWAKSEIEMLVFGSQNPDSILKGNAYPENRHLYQHDLYHARAAILGGFLDKILVKHQRSDGEIAFDLEDDVRRLEINFDQEYYAKIYLGDEEIPIPWISHNKKAKKKLSAKRELIVLIRARDSAEIRRGFQADLEVALKIEEKFGQKRLKPYVFILYPSDFKELIFEDDRDFINEAEENGIGIMVCPETVASIDMDASRRLISGRMVRQ